jgi:argininosuccinate lyase
MKLWSKNNTSTAQAIEIFTVGNDPQFDLLLAKHDVQGSIAHAKMLAAVGLITDAESIQLVEELNNILQSINENHFTIDSGVEDVHSQVEWMLTQKLGDTGKKIHTGRSRNDQVATDIKLYLREEILNIKEQVYQLFQVLQQLSEQHKQQLMPGYTHLQVAMPSSFGLWLGSAAESLVDDMELLAAAYRICNKNPLGSGAGYGSSFPLNRKMTTELLSFKNLHVNSIYAQTSRGKTEKVLSYALASVAATLNKLCSDICLFVGQDYGFLRFPNEITTGSSLMPHKKNPDVFELTRARCNQIQSIPNTLTLLLTNMPTGYHRDVQLTKEILFPAIENLKQCLDIQCLVLPQMEVTGQLLQQEKYKYLFSVEAVNELVKQGMPFRDAYKEIGNRIEAGNFEYNSNQSLNHTHEGSLGNLGTAEIAKMMQEVLNRFE